MAVTPGPGFDSNNDADCRDEKVEIRIRQAMLDEFVNYLGWTEDAARRHIEQYLSGSRTRLAVDAMIEEHDLGSKRLLEVGSGRGNTLLHLLSKGVDVTGLEPSREYADIVAQRLTDRSLPVDRVVRGIGEDLPFVDGSFDFVLSQQVLEHVDNPERCLAEIKRVLRPGGTVLISAPNYLSFSENHYMVAWFPGMPAVLGALYLRSRGKDPWFYINHVNNLTYPRVIRAMRAIDMEDCIFQKYAVAWRHPARSGKSPVKRMIVSALSVFGSAPSRLAYHGRRIFKNEITYHYRKPGR